MFQFESLELLYWDYWERVKIPFDERIIVIVGPNGSGKTTLLDALRTLLGIKTSEKRDYKRYARRSNKPHSWIVATVKNQRDRSNRPCFYPIFTEKVTLACRIEKKGGEWQRSYFVAPGAVSIEQFTTADAAIEPLGLREYQSVLQKAGFSSAMLRVLSLEQGSTDRLCEYSPKEMLSLVYDAFGDKPTLDNYEKARHEQTEAEQELDTLRFRTERLQNELSTLKNRVNNYLEYKSLIDKKTYLETEVKAQSNLAALMDAIDGMRRNAVGLRKEITNMKASLSELSIRVSSLAEKETALRKQKEDTEQKIKDIHEKLIEENRKRAKIEHSIEELEKLKKEAAGLILEDADLLKQIYDDALKNKGVLENRLEILGQEQAEFEKSIKKLIEGGRPERTIEEFSSLLNASNISHSFLYEGVEIIEEKWRLAIESLLRGYRYIIILDNQTQRWQAWEIGEMAGYRHFIVANTGNINVSAPKGSALEKVRLHNSIPEWVRKTLADVYLVDTVQEGQKLPEGSTFVTAKGFIREKRGGRSITVSEGDFIFGAAGRKRQIEFLEKQVEAIKIQKNEFKEQLTKLGGHIADISLRLEQQEKLRQYLFKKDEEGALRQELDSINNLISLIDKEKEHLYEESKNIEAQYIKAFKELTESRQKLETESEEFKKKYANCANLQKDLFEKIKEFRTYRSSIPPAWRTPEKIVSYREKFGDAKNVSREIADIETRLNEGDWEKDPQVIELKKKIEQDYNYELDNVKKKEYEFSETKRTTDEARGAYIDFLRASVRFYEKNLKVLAAMADIGVDVIKPHLKNDDNILKEAGIEIKWNFDGKGFISTDDGEASGGQQVIKSLILLTALMMDEHSKGGFVFIDEPFAHLDVFNIDKVAEFLLSTETQFIITSPNTHNVNIYRPALLSIVTKKKTSAEPFAPPPVHIRKLNA